MMIPPIWAPTTINILHIKQIQGFAESLQPTDEVTSKYGSQCSKGLLINVYLSTALHRQGCIQSVFSNTYMYQVCCKDSAKPCTHINFLLHCMLFLGVQTKFKTSTRTHRPIKRSLIKTLKCKPSVLIYMYISAHA